MNESEQELAFPVYVHVDELGLKEISALSCSNAIRYRSFSAAHAEIERQTVEDDREFCVHKRRRTEPASMQTASGPVFREANRDVVQPIPRCLVAPEAIARASFEQFVWVSRATRGPTEISERFAADYKLGVQPSVATCNAVVRSLLRLGNVHGVLDFLDELVLCYPRLASAASTDNTNVEGTDESAPPLPARKVVGAHPSTFRLIVSELMAHRWYTRCAYVALAASACYPETNSEPPVISTVVWIQILDALEDAADANTDFSLTDEGLGPSARIQVASRVFSLLAASRRHSAVFTARRILRHVECLLSVGNVIAAQAFSLTHIIHSVDFSLPHVPQQLVSHALSQILLESLGSFSCDPQHDTRENDEEDRDGKDANDDGASFVVALMEFCFAKDVVIRPEAYCELLERHAELSIDASMVLAIIVQQTRHVNHIATSLPAVIGDEAKGLLNGWCRVISAACRALQHVSHEVLQRCSDYYFPGASVASFFAALWRNRRQEWIRSADHRPLLAAVLDTGLHLGGGLQHCELLLSSLALVLKMWRADPQFYADVEMRSKSARLLHRCILAVLSPQSNVTASLAPGDLDEDIILGLLVGRATVSEHHHQLAQPSLLEASLRRIVGSRDAYVVVVDDAALTYCGQRPSRLAALDAMLAKYDTTCGGHMLVSTETLSTLCQSLSSTAERCSVGWVAERMLNRTRWMAVMPLGPSLEAIRQQRCRTDAGHTGTNVRDFTPSEESALQLFCTCKQQIGHAKALLITGSSKVVTVATQLDVKPVVLVSDLLTKLGAS